MRRRGKFSKGKSRSEEKLIKRKRKCKKRRERREK